MLTITIRLNLTFLFCLEFEIPLGSFVRSYEPYTLRLSNPMALKLFGTVAHFVLFESLHGPLLCGPPLFDYSSVALRFEKKGLHFRVSSVCPVISLISKKRSSPLEERFWS